MTKTVSDGGLSGTVPNGAWTYTYSGWQIVEEDTGIFIQYIWGQYIDELIQMKATGGTIGPQPRPADSVYYLLSDLLYRSVALTDHTGAVVEAYDTDAYGNTLLFSGPGTDGLWFTNVDVQAAYSACRYVFTGREYDAETMIYSYRARYYSPSFGRFIGRDPALYDDGSDAYEAVGGRPLVKLDPAGLGAMPPKRAPAAPAPPPPNSGPSSDPTAGDVLALIFLFPLSLGGCNRAPAPPPPPPCGTFTVTYQPSLKLAEYSSHVTGFEVGYNPCPNACAGGTITILQVISGPTQGGGKASIPPHFDIQGGAAKGAYPPGYVESGATGLTAMGHTKYPYGLTDSPGWSTGGVFALDTEYGGE